MTEGLGPAPETDEEREMRSPRWIAPIVTWLASAESKDVTGRVFEASGNVLAIAEGWVRGPRQGPVEDPLRHSVRSCSELLAQGTRELGDGRRAGRLAATEVSKPTAVQSKRSKPLIDHGPIADGGREHAPRRRRVPLFTVSDSPGNTGFEKRPSMP